jgi:hypothetical protein
MDSTAGQWRNRPGRTSGVSDADGSLLRAASLASYSQESAEREDLVTRLLERNSGSVLERSLNLQAAGRLRYSVTSREGRPSVLAGALAPEVLPLLVRRFSAPTSGSPGRGRWQPEPPSSVMARVQSLLSRRDD